MDFIRARFIPEAWINDHAQEIDGATDFDATLPILSMDAEAVRSLEDNQYESDELARAAGLLEDHDGPFRVEIEAGLCAFFNVVSPSEITDEHLGRARALIPDHKARIARGETDGYVVGLKPEKAHSVDMACLPVVERARIGDAITNKEIVGMSRIVRTESGGDAYESWIRTDSVDQEQFPQLYAFTRKARERGGSGWLLIKCANAA